MSNRLTRGEALVGSLNADTALTVAGAAVPSGSAAANIAEIVITYSANDPSITPDGAVTVADGAVPTVAELLELVEELKANQDAIIVALEAFSIAASA